MMAGILGCALRKAFEERSLLGPSRSSPSSISCRVWLGSHQPVIVAMATRCAGPASWTGPQSGWSATLDRYTLDGLSNSLFQNSVSLTSLTPRAFIRLMAQVVLVARRTISWHWDCHFRSLCTTIPMMMRSFFISNTAELSRHGWLSLGVLLIIQNSQNKVTAEPGEREGLH